MTGSFAGINMLGRLTTKVAISWLGFKRSKAKLHTMKALSKGNKHFHNRLNIFEYTRVILAKASFNNLQTLKTRMNGYDEELDIVDKTSSNF